MRCSITQNPPPRTFFLSVLHTFRLFPRFSVLFITPRSLTFHSCAFLRRQTLLATTSIAILHLLPSILSHRRNAKSFAPPCRPPKQKDEARLPHLRHTIYARSPVAPLHHNALCAQKSPLSALDSDGLSESALQRPLHKKPRSAMRLQAKLPMTSPFKRMKSPAPQCGRRAGVGLGCLGGGVTN